jgi:LysW-gamma-L-lysine carboxypeptidase
MTPEPGEFLAALLEIESLSGAEGAASGWLVERMRELGYARAEVDAAGNAVGEVGHGDRLIVLLGHIDTVAGRVPVRREGRRLYGRGAVDAKGPLAAFTLAAAAIEPPPGWRLVVVGAVEEEAATSRGARAVAARLRPAACVIGEPSGWDRICVGYKGRLLADLEIERPGHHSAGREPGACELAVEFWNRVAALAAERNRRSERVFEQLTPSLRQLASGGDGLREWARARLGLRLPPGLDPGELARELQGLAPPGALLTTSAGEPAFRCPKNSPLVRAFLAAIRARGGRPAFTVKSGTSDMNVVGPVWGCPVLAYGPGDSDLDHSPQEHVDLDELVAAIGVLGDALRALVGADPPASGPSPSPA